MSYISRKCFYYLLKTQVILLNALIFGFTNKEEVKDFRDKLAKFTEESLLSEEEKKT